MVKVAVYGHTGRLGVPLVKILENHPEVKIVYTESQSQGGSGDLNSAEFVFLALPYGESKKYFHKFPDKRVIDLSIDHRNDDNWVYGLPEINKDKIRNAQYVANPGCYATSILLGLIPLRGKIQNISIGASSGISGAGEAKKEKDNFVVYKEGDAHPQIQEIKNILEIDEILFVPIKIENTDKGIVSIIFAEYKENKSVINKIKSFHENNPFVRIVENIETKDVVGTNYCNIKPMFICGKIIIISALDNLLKGGSGQAVQNFNIMNGFAENLGLLN